MSPGPLRYLIVTPARDEAAYLPGLAASLLAQTVPVARWVIVDDGSSDGTLEIARGLAERDPRISVVARERRAARRAGCGDIEAYKAGLATAGDLDGYDFVGKLDADLVLPPDYFERLFAEFERDAGLGVAGGHCYNRAAGGRLVLDRVPDSHVRGAVKTYRRECLRDLGSLPDVPGWDTVDEVLARARGWRTASFREPGVIHCKPVTGGSGSVLRGRFVLGRISHFLGYRPAYLLLRVLRNAARPPYVVGGLAMGAGYLSGVALSSGRIEDAEFRRELRAYQRARLLSLVGVRVPEGAGRPDVV